MRILSPCIHNQAFDALAEKAQQEKDSAAAVRKAQKETNQTAPTPLSS